MRLFLFLFYILYYWYMKNNKNNNICKNSVRKYVFYIFECWIWSRIDEFFENLNNDDNLSFFRLLNWYCFVY